MSFAHVDLENLLFFVSSIPLALLPPPPLSSLSSEERDLVEMAHVELSVPGSLTCGCGALYLLPSAAGGSFSDDD